jgi:hypothetical protein
MQLERQCHIRTIQTALFLSFITCASSFLAVPMSNALSSNSAKPNASWSQTRFD